MVLRSLGSIGYITQIRDGSEKYVDTPGSIYEIDTTTDFTVLGLKQDLSVEASKKVFFETGFDLR